MLSRQPIKDSNEGTVGVGVSERKNRLRVGYSLKVCLNEASKVSVSFVEQKVSIKL